MTVYSATPGMVDDLAGQAAPVPVPGLAPGAVPTSSDPTKVQTPAEYLRSRTPRADLAGVPGESRPWQGSDER